MRSELASLDLYFLLRELSVLNRAKIDKVYQKDNIVIFQMHVPGSGKSLLKTIIPGFIFFSGYKEEFGPQKFALSLRKHVNNAWIKSIEQMGFERILEVVLSNENKIYIELFRPGNIILCNREDKIIMAYEYKGFGSRLIRPGNKYEYPKQKDTLNLSKEQFSDILLKSEKKSVVITLAVELGLGGLYAEELCIRAGVDKAKEDVSAKDCAALFDSLHKLCKEKMKGYIYDGIISPVELVSKSDPEIFKSFSKALDEHFLKNYKDEKSEKHNRAKEKIEGIIRQQEAMIKGLEKSCKENQMKGEKIYENYVLISKRLEESKKSEEVRNKNSYNKKDNTISVEI